MKNHKNETHTIGWWQPGQGQVETGPEALEAALFRVGQPLYLLDVKGHYGVGRGGTVCMGAHQAAGAQGFPLCAFAPALPPENLGAADFKAAHGLRYAYIAGAMAHGITSVDMVEAVGRNGMLGFFGSAGLALGEVERNIHQLQQRLDGLPFGVNLINSPHDPELEAGLVELYLQRGIKRVSASAYLDVTLPLVHYRVQGIHRDPQGRIRCPQTLIAKVSREEIARKFFSPPPQKMLAHLVDRGIISTEQAQLAAQVPLAPDMTAEADSGGHTDNRPAIALLPTLSALRDKLAAAYRYDLPLHVGLGGGIATPAAAAAAFAMGAAFIVTGSINQACVESGTSAAVREMLIKAQQADVTMAPAADMFELGVKVQVLKRGTLFPLRAAKLYELYSRYECYEAIPPEQRQILERDFFRSSFDEIWQQTREFFARRDPRQIRRAQENQRHKMALVFRSYLGQSSTWATRGDPDRRIDYQIWCGPAMGAFNAWVQGSFLEPAEQRRTVVVAKNLLLGAAVVTRLGLLRCQNVRLPPGMGTYRPLDPEQMASLLDF